MGRESKSLGTQRRRSDRVGAREKEGRASHLDSVVVNLAVETGLREKFLIVSDRLRWASPDDRPYRASSPLQPQQHACTTSS